MKKNELDLHGVRHGDVQDYLDEFLFHHLSSDTISVIIITGNSPEMKAVVRNVLEDYDLIAEEDFLNSGQLNVKL